jgi:hypothetical protein
MVKWLIALALLGMALARGEEGQCEWSKARRTVVQASALSSLTKEGFTIEATGVLAYQVRHNTQLPPVSQSSRDDMPPPSFPQVPQSGEQLAGNPNTIYGIGYFPGSRRKGLLPRGYPEPTLPSQVGPSPFG